MELFWNPEKFNVTSSFWPLEWRLGRASRTDCPLLCEAIRPSANRKAGPSPSLLGGKPEHNLKEGSEESYFRTEKGSIFQDKQKTKHWCIYNT